MQHELNIGQDVSLIAPSATPMRTVAAHPAAGLPAGPAGTVRLSPVRPLEPPEFLDYSGTELVLISASRDRVASDFDLDPERETEEIITELKLERSVHPLRPLLTGDWE